MALVFQNKSVGTAKMHDAATGTKFFTVPGVAADISDPSTYETQINRLLAIGGKEAVADEHMVVSQVKGVIDDGE